MFGDTVVFWDICVQVVLANMCDFVLPIFAQERLCDHQALIKESRKSFAWFWLKMLFLKRSQLFTYRCFSLGTFSQIFFHSVEEGLGNIAWQTP